MRFIQALDHNTCKLPEQATLSLQTAVVRARLRLGMRAIVRNPAISESWQTPCWTWCESGQSGTESLLFSPVIRAELRRLGNLSTLKSPRTKGNARFCVLLSKSVVNDMFIVGGRDGVRLARSIICRGLASPTCLLFPSTRLAQTLDLCSTSQDGLHEQALAAPDPSTCSAVSAPPPPGVAQAVPSGALPRAHEQVEPNPAMRPLEVATSSCAVW